MPTTAAVHIADRVFKELRRDYRTIFLFVAAPTFVVVLVWGILANHPDVFDRVGLLVVGLFPTAPALLFVAFAVQRERYRGTLEHLMTTPASRLDVLLGYALAFAVPAMVQIGLMVAVTYGLLGLTSAAPWWGVAVLALLSCLLGVAMGVFTANLARNELQLTKVLIATAVPHVVLSGLFRPHEEMVGWMRAVSDVAPWRYLVGAISELQFSAGPTAALWRNTAVVLGIVTLLSAVSLNTVLRRQTA